MGRAIALALAGHGSHVVCVDVNPHSLNQTVESIRSCGGEALGILADVTDRTQVETMVSQTIAAYGQVDILINNAAIFRSIGGVWEVDPAEWWQDVTTNLLGPFLCCRAVLPHMMERDQGIIINLSGGGFGGPVLGGSGYSASKTGLIRLTDTLALELGGSELARQVTGKQYNIQVYAVEPAFVQGPMNEYVATSQQGQKWLPFVKANLEKGLVQDANDVGQGICKLIELSNPSLSGRVFTYRMDFENLLLKAEEIKKNDLHQLRIRFLI